MRILILLGFPDGNIQSGQDNDVYTTKIGGRPIWLDERFPLSRDLVMCKNCGREMVLLFQGYIPLPLSPYDRVIYVWGCNQQNCMKLLRLSDDNHGNNSFVKGHSSGAHLGALVTVRDAIIKSRTSSTYFEDIDPELELPKIAGVYDIARHFHCEAKRGVEEISAMTRVMGDTLENLALNSPTLLLDNAIRDAQINPETLNNLLPPKILLIHGDKDNCVPTESSIRFNHVLNELYIKDLKLRIFPGMGHDEPITSLMFSPFTSKYTLQLLSEMADFMLY
ncbi:8674_t:CDS:2 [Entrophospora sp. SA101]|nr:8674_t:CDS:2 [Entrophospora sp. SA101]